MAPPSFLSLGPACAVILAMTAPAAAQGLPGAAGVPAQAPPPAPSNSSQAITAAMNAYAERTHGDARWPRVPLAPGEVPPLDAREIDIQVAVAGPGGFQAQVRATANSRGASSTSMGLPGEGRFSIRGRDAPDGVQLIAGLLEPDGDTFVGSLAGASTTAPFSMDLGGGYTVSFTPTVRIRTAEDVTRMNAMLPPGMTLGRPLAPPSSTAEPPPPAPPAVLSPLTNAVIREGDERAQ